MLFAASVTVVDQTYIHTSSYYQSANDMVKRLHRLLKAFLATSEPRKRWADHFPFVLLGFRSALKEDLGCSVAELVYSVPLRLPGEIFSPPSPDSLTRATDSVTDLRRTFQHLRPILPHQKTARHVVVSQDLDCALTFSYATISFVDLLCQPTAGRSKHWMGRLSRWTSTDVMTLSPHSVKPAYLFTSFPV